MPATQRKRSSDGEPLHDDSDTPGSDWELETGDEAFGQSRPRRRNAPVERFWRLVSGRTRRTRLIDEASRTGVERLHVDAASPTARWQRESKSRSSFWVKGLLWRIPLGILCCFGVLHIVLVFLAHKSAFWDRREFLPDWGRPGQPGEGLAKYPTDATRDIIPVPCHSHNDYWRRIPLFEAIHWGCTGVEADVWQIDGEAELLVGHSKSSLAKDRTFANLYIDPIVQLLDSMNPTNEYTTTSGQGVFDTDPAQTLVLLVDFKTDGHDLFPIVQAQLEPLRSKNYLSSWNGTAVTSRAVTVVGTGNAPFDLITANKTYRDIFFDAPIDAFYDGSTSSLTPRSPGQGGTGTGDATPDSFDASNSYYASTSFGSSIGLPYGELSARQLDLLRGQIKGAHERGLKARYWETPSWPTSLRNRLWEVLVHEGVDMLNVDDLEAAAKFDWRRRVKHGWVDA